ncbi:MAG: nicotinate phosphoribosyltransferase [Bacteroidales bacterium]
MDILNNHNGLYTDFYELTMAQGYFMEGMQEKQVVFDYNFRKNPFDCGYVIFAGLEDLIGSLKNFKYSNEAIDYLRQNGFNPDFLEYLKKFSFRGTIKSVREGEVVFPITPILRVEGNIIECQILETIILNYLNFESLIATKASRIRKVAENRIVSDFGLRRAQGLGGLQASRAAVIGGIDSTSNVLAGYLYDLDVSGTQAHSWIQSFNDELTAFRKYAETYPSKTILLVDTYDTLRSGVPNAIKVAKELKEKGHDLKAIRLDSGDLAYLSKKARKMLDEAGLESTKILASNQLNEYIIRSLLFQGAPIDGFGVGTELVTGKSNAALDGVYKLAMMNEIPKLKLSDTFEKITIPGKKDIFRFYDDHGYFYADCIVLEGENIIKEMHHPYEKGKKCNLEGLKYESLLETALDKGEITTFSKSIEEIKKYRDERLAKLPEEHQRFEKPHIYKVGLSKKLNDLRNNLVYQMQNKNPVRR